MADVVPFVPKQPDAPRKTPTGQMAQILFFTGVRYERQAESAAETAAAPRQRRGRRAEERLRRPV